MIDDRFEDPGVSLQSLSGLITGSFPLNRECCDGALHISQLNSNVTTWHIPIFSTDFFLRIILRDWNIHCGTCRTKQVLKSECSLWLYPMYSYLSCMFLKFVFFEENCDTNVRGFGQSHQSSPLFSPSVETLLQIILTIKSILMFLVHHTQWADFFFHTDEEL